MIGRNLEEGFGVLTKMLLDLIDDYRANYFVIIPSELVTPNLE